MRWCHGGDSKFLFLLSMGLTTRKLSPNFRLEIRVKNQWLLATDVQRAFNGGAS